MKWEATRFRKLIDVFDLQDREPVLDALGTAFIVSLTQGKDHWFMKRLVIGYELVRREQETPIVP